MSFSTDVPIGSELLGFRVERQLGRGGMGVVYLAEDTRLRRKVALKLLTPELAQDGDFRDRLLAESELAASLDHPNIVPIYEAGEADGRIFIAMRYVEGADLKALLCQGPLDPAHTVAIVAQVAAALDAAHAHGLVHRDVKPSNVLLAESLTAGRPEHVYLADFGLTRRLSEPELLTLEPQLAGTIDYIAPEQIRGDAVDGRADLYSLGCLLYECLTGRPPYRHEQDLALLFAHLEQQPPTLTAEKHDLPNEIDGVIATALAKDPDDRYQTGDELAAAARDALGLGSPARRWWASPTILAAVAGVALVAIAVAGYVATQGTPSAAALPGADALVRIDPRTNTVDKRFDVGREASDVAVGGGYVWVTNVSDSTVSRLDPESGEMQTIPVPGTPVSVAADARSVVVVTGPGPGNVNVVSLDVDTGSITSQATQPGDQLTTPVVASDGHDLWLADAEQRLAMRAAALVAVDDRGALGRPLPLIPIPKDATNLLKAYETFDDMAASADGVWIAGDSLGRSVWHLDPRTEKLVGTVHLSFVPKGIAAGAGGVWVTSLLGDTVSRIDPASHRITATIPVGRGSDGVAARGGAVWVANVIDGTVSLVDAAGRRVTSTIDVGGPPVGIAAGPDGVWAIVRR